MNRRWACADTQSQGSPSAGKKRKRENDGNDDLPFILQGMKVRLMSGEKTLTLKLCVIIQTPDTPYGAFLGRNPSPKTRKFWKLQCDEAGRFEMTEEEKKEFEVRRKSS